MLCSRCVYNVRLFKFFNISGIRSSGAHDCVNEITIDFDEKIFLFTFLSYSVKGFYSLEYLKFRDS